MNALTRILALSARFCLSQTASIQPIKDLDKLKAKKLTSALMGEHNIWGQRIR